MCANNLHFSRRQESYAIPVQGPSPFLPRESCSILALAIPLLGVYYYYYSTHKSQ